MAGGRPIRLPDPQRQELLELWDRLDEQGRRMVLQVARSGVRPTGR